MKQHQCFRHTQGFFHVFPIRLLQNTHAYGVLLAAMLLFLTGCPKAPIVQPLIPGTAVESVTTEEVSVYIDQRIREFQNLRSLGKVGIRTWEEEYRFSEVFVLETPSRFRLETLGAFDQPAVFLISDEMILSLYTKKHNKYYRGVATQENMFKLSGINLSVEDMILVLSGNPPRLHNPRAEWGFFIPEQQLFYLERLSLHDNRVQRIWFDTTISAIVFIREHQLPEGDVFLDIQFKTYSADEGGYPVPQEILINRPLERTLVNITYDATSLTINQPIEPTLFTFTPPVNAQTHILEDVHAEEFEQLAPYEEFRVND